MHVDPPSLFSRPITASFVGIPQQAVAAVGRSSSPPASASFPPMVKYHGLARPYLIQPRLLMRPLLNGGTLAGLLFRSVRAASQPSRSASLSATDFRLAVQVTRPLSE